MRILFKKWSIHINKAFENLLIFHGNFLSIHHKGI